MHTTHVEGAASQRAKEIAWVVRHGHRFRWWLLPLFAGVPALAGTLWFLSRRAEESSGRWKLAEVDRGDIVLRATATGNLEPESSVAIGAEISGRVVAVEVEVNDPVKRGQVLARLDTEALANQRKQAAASLRAARAVVQQARATLEESRALESRLSALLPGAMVSTHDFEVAQGARVRAAAALDTSVAELDLARERYRLARTNLAKATITSPVDGVVLARRVEPGNTIVASLQSPELFVLAEDLRSMKMHVDVDEADVGLVRSGQRASFTVDAWPDETFEATVVRVYLYPTITDNVVTYTAELTVRNADGLLRPGMTAVATIITEARENVLRVPNAALFFRPASDQDETFSLLPRPRWGRGAGTAATGAVWTLRDGRPVRVPLLRGRSDGRFTEVLGGEITQGDPVIVGRELKEGAGD